MGVKLFISYRRGDSADVTGRIGDYLSDTFGESTIFKDVDSIPVGTDFRKAIAQAVSACDLLLVIVGPNWLDATDGRGNRRLDDPSDYVRIEVEAALRRDIPVIPLLLGATPMAGPQELPESLRELAYRSGTRVRPDPDFRGDMERVVGAIGSALGSHPARGGASRGKRFRRLSPSARVGMLGVLLALCGVAGGVFWLSGLGGGPRPGVDSTPGGPAGALAAAVTAHDRGRFLFHRLDVSGGRVFHEIEGGRGARLPVGLVNEPTGVTTIAAASAGPWLHVVAVDREGAVRRAEWVDDRWNGSWFPVPVPRPLDAVALAAVPGKFEVELFGRSRGEGPFARLTLQENGQWLGIREGAGGRD